MRISILHQYLSVEVRRQISDVFFSNVPNRPETPFRRGQTIYDRSIDIAGRVRSHI